jgi:hypothetical protein
MIIDKVDRRAQNRSLYFTFRIHRGPAEERQAILLGDAALADELLRMTDEYTDELFPYAQECSAGLQLASWPTGAAARPQDSEWVHHHHDDAIKPIR